MARPGLMTHRKFLRLAHAVGSRALALGVLELLWGHGYDTGDDYLGTKEDIEALVGWTGERGRLTRALADAGGSDRPGFIEPIDDVGGVPGGARATTATRYRIHDLADHAPGWVRRRLRSPSPGDGDLFTTGPPGAGEGSVTPQRGLTEGSVSPNSQLVAFVRTSDLVRTEVPERETDLGVRVPAAARRRDEPVLRFPVVGRGPSEWPLLQTHVEEWSAIFPGLDVLGEARKALGWVLANLGHRKTFEGMPRFLYRWCAREVNRGGGTRAVSNPPAASTCPHEPQCGTIRACIDRTLTEARNGRSRQRARP